MSRYIDADKLIKTLNREGVPFNEDVNYFILHAPAADVAEVRHGRWIVKDKGIIVTSYCCSECGQVVRDDTGYDVSIDYPYCHCGAKMDEVEE